VPLDSEMMYREATMSSYPCKNIKQTVTQQRYQTTGDLKQAVRRALNLVTPQMHRNMSHRTWRGIVLCHENDGAQMDTVDN
jgi:hypothetical protein